MSVYWSLRCGLRSKQVTSSGHATCRDEQDVLKRNLDAHAMVVPFYRPRHFLIDYVYARSRASVSKRLNFTDSGNTRCI
jgi:hypothetical protein